MVTANEVREIIREELINSEERVIEKVELSIAAKLDTHKADVLREAKAIAKRESQQILGGFVEAIRGEFSKVFDYYEHLEKDLLAQQCHSMKYDLLVGGIPERGAGETYRNMTEDVIKVFRDTMKVDADIINDLQFKAIHRLGKPTNNRARTIIVVVNKLEYVQGILKNGRNLKDTPFTVRSHLPKVLANYRTQVVELRKTMIAADRTRKVRVVENKGIPALQEKLRGSWKTLQDFYNMPDRLVQAPRFEPLRGLMDTLLSVDDAAEEMFSDAVANSTVVDEAD